MKTVVTKGLNEKETKEIRQEFVASAHLRKRFIQLFEERIVSSRSKTIASSTYDSPNWAYLQADNVGYERALKEVISILESE